MISFLYFMKTFSLIFGSIAAACNAFVLVLVFALKNSTVGPYRILLIFYLALNLFVSIVTCIFSPIMSIDENFFLVVGPGVVGYKIVCTIGSYCMVAFCFTLVGLILVLSLSYIYRYVTICCQHRLRIFTEYQGLCIIGIICFFFFAGFMGCSLMWMMPNQEKNRLFASHFSDHFGLADIESVSYMGAVAFTNDRLETDFAVMIGIRLACLFIPIGVIVYCGACIFLSLREQFSMVSHSSMATKYQSKLFALLLLQTLGPIILLYIPLTAIFVFSLARYKNFFLCDLISISIALSQLLDPIIVLFCVSDYRRAASSLVGLFSPYKVSTSGSKTVPSPAVNPESTPNITEQISFPRS